MVKEKKSYGKKKNNEQNLIDKEKIITAIEKYLESAPYSPFRCAHCGRWLANEKVIIGAFETKCKSCKQINTFYNIDLDALFEAIEKIFSKNS